MQMISMKDSVKQFHFEVKTGQSPVKQKHFANFYHEVTLITQTQ